MKRFIIVLVAVVALSSGCGSDSGRSGSDSGVSLDIAFGDVFPDATDLLPEESSHPLCESGAGSSCVVDDPCYLGQGVCDESGACVYPDEQITSCDTTSYPCLSSSMCDGLGGCKDVLKDGWCRIAGNCVAEGELAGENSCLVCDPEEDRGAWFALSDGSPCSAENPECVESASCQGGQCVAVPLPGACSTDTDCVDEDDGNLCNGTLRCVQCACVFSPNTVVVCPPANDPPCVETRCIPESGQCVALAKEDGTSCNDEDPCTLGDQCVSGECTPGPTLPDRWFSSVGPHTAALRTVVSLNDAAHSIYAAGVGPTLYRFSDDSLAASAFLLPLPANVEILHLQVIGSLPPRLLLLAGTTLFVWGAEGEWNELPLALCSATASVPGSASVILAACNGTLYRSSNGGESFEPVSSIPGAVGAGVPALAALDSSTLFAATRTSTGGHLYRSLDGGLTWAKREPPGWVAGRSVADNGLFASPQLPGELWVGLIRSDGYKFHVMDPGLFVTSDSGDNFTAPTIPMESDRWNPLGVDSGNRVIAAVGDSLIASPGGGETSWSLFSSPPTSGDVQMDLIRDGVVLAGSADLVAIPASNGLGVFDLTTESWKLLSQGLSGSALSALTWFPSGGAMVGQDRRSGSLYVTHDGAEHWFLVDNVPGLLDHTYACGSAGPSGGALFATDGTTLWSDGEQFLQFEEGDGISRSRLTAIADDPLNANRLAVSRGGMGLFLSMDKGHPLGAGFTPVAVGSTRVTDFLFSAQDPDVSLVAIGSTESSPASVLRWTGGDSTEPVLVAPDDGTPREFHLARSGQSSERLYAASTGTDGELFRSTDGGSSWSSILGLPNLGVLPGNAMVVTAEDSGSYLVALAHGPVVRYDGVLEQWSAYEGGPSHVVSVIADPWTPGGWIVADGSSGDLWQLDDEGQFAFLHGFNLSDFRVKGAVSGEGVVAVWLQHLFEPVGALFFSSGSGWVMSELEEPLSDVLIVPAGEDFALLAGGELGGVFKVDMAGNVLGTSDPVGGPVLAFSVQPDAPEVIWAASGCGEVPSWVYGETIELGSHCGVWRSDDGGASWSQKLFAARPCVGVSVHPSMAGTVIASCPGSGAFLSLNNGGSWSNLRNESLPETSPFREPTAALFLGNRLVVGSEGSGLIEGVFSEDTGSWGGWDFAHGDGIRGVVATEDVGVVLREGSSGSLMVATTPGGTIFSTNSGVNWERADSSLFWGAGPDGSALMPFVRPSTDAGFEGLKALVPGLGLLESRDGGVHFGLEGGAPASLAEGRAILLAPSDSGDFVAATSFAVELLSSSADGSWSSVWGSWAPDRLESLRLGVEGEWYAWVNGAGLWRKTAASEWMPGAAIDFSQFPHPEFPQRTLQVWPVCPTSSVTSGPLCTGSDPDGVFCSNDDGLSFSLVAHFLGDTRVTGLAVSSSGQTMVVAIEGGLIRRSTSLDWESLNISLPGSCPTLTFATGSEAVLFGLCVTPALPGFTSSEPESALLVRVDLDQGVLETVEALPLDLEPVGLALDPDFSSVVYVATRRHGVYRSLDGGATFEAWNTGISAGVPVGGLIREGTSLSLIDSPKRLVFATHGGGVYYREVGAGCNAPSLP